LQNHLAVANTRLLRAYGSIDARVRTLVFLIKYWAKRRHLNSPSDGTLSSYGFIICLIHFLQV
jgi:terminal uridylyltransferase